MLYRFFIKKKEKTSPIELAPLPVACTLEKGFTQSACSNQANIYFTNAFTNTKKEHKLHERLIQLFFGS